MPSENGAPRILAVDDSPSARKVFHEVLVGLGVSTDDLRLAANAAEGLQIVREWGPDIIFLDVELRAPEAAAPARKGASGDGAMNGDELGRFLLRAQPRPHVVVVTALDRDDRKVRALLADGAADVIVKPVRAARVDEVLRALGANAGSSRPHR